MPYAFCEQIGKEIRDISDEIPFDIPESWEWVRIEALAKTSGTESFADGPFGSNLKKEHQIDKPEVRIIQLSNLGEFGWRNDNIKYTSYEHLKTIARCEVEPGNFVIAKMMPAGRTVIVPDLGTKICLGSDAIKFVPHPIIYEMYLYYAMHSDMFLNQVSAESHGVTRIRTSLNKLKTYILPIPPISEQHRIVAKIEELLPYIERYGKAEEQLTELNTTFPEALKKSILQEAVQGKLVPQNPDDEPASVLLERIRAEKQALIKAGKIKKDKHESVIVTRDKIPYEIIDGKERCIADEVPFELPESWCWCRLGTIFQHNTGKALNSSNHQGTKMQYITTSNLYWDRFELDKLKEMLFTDSEVEKCTVTKGDLLVCEGGDIGRAAIWNYDYPMRIQNHIHRLRSYAPVEVYFFYYVFYLYKRAGLIGGKGIGIQGLSSNAIDKLLMPLPPLSEQKRIVAKIEELMQYCDKL